MKYFASSSISANASETKVKNAIKKYYSGAFGSSIEVNKTMYDVNGLNTTYEGNATKHVFHIQLNKFITGVSTAQVLISKKTTSTVTFDVPSTV